MKGRFTREGTPTSDLELRHLRAFVALADQGSVTAASRALALAQSTVSEALAALERSWGAEFSPDLGPQVGFGPEALFEKDVYGAFTNTGLEEWLRAAGVQSVLIVGFYAHMCLSTSAREGLIRGFEVVVDPNATGARDLEDEVLGRQTADEVRRTALLQLTNMGVTVAPTTVLAGSSASDE
jgi:nicotinamidase-related amidase